jgi:demethylmenaquinone methyltransferase/2-methoxy-6-polyprenyl-1,4-benzoquinol methylase
MSEEINFGFKKVKAHLKQGLVNDVFNSVHEKYDLMNDLMSLGMHRLWKREFVDHISSFSGKFLDVASGSGDIALMIINRAKDKNIKVDITLSDINQSMLDEAQNKLLNHGLFKNITYKVANAEQLPFEAETFDYYTIAFGLRNCSDFGKVISEAYRVLKPGGKFLCLEFSKVTNPCLSHIYKTYSNMIIPKIGEIVANDAKSYEYLVESIEVFPDQESLKKMITDNGFEMAKFKNLSGGIVAIHMGYKI